MQKFFEDTIVSSFIKEFVYSRNIPKYTSAVDGDFVVSGVIYIYIDKIIKITKSGILGGSGVSGAEYKVICRYKFGEKLFKVTENFASRYNYYDSETHYHLGRYLRLLRDCKGIDLMPFYNCFNYKIVNDIYLGKNKDTILFVGDNLLTERTNEYKIILVPINFGRKYTICLDSYCGFRAKPVFYGRFGRIMDIGISKKKVDGEGNDTYAGFLRFNNEMDVTTSSFKSPVVYNCDMLSSQYVGEYVDEGGNNQTILCDLSDEDRRRLKSIERYLYLLIQIPINNKSSILVQEGDYTLSTKEYLEKEIETVDGKEVVNYTKTGTLNKVFNEVDDSDKNISNLPWWQNKLYLSNLQLQRLNTQESYPFSDRLIEYLLDNVITKDDWFGGDIKRVQIDLNRIKEMFSEDGVWTDGMRKEMFTDYITNKEGVRKTDCIDINGYIDKDSEYYLNLVKEKKKKR